MRPASETKEKNITRSEPVTTIILNAGAQSRLVFCCDHAGAEIPLRLGDLGVSEADRSDHIALDIGVFSTTCWVVGALGAPLVAQPISRLVIDCNRRPESPDSIRLSYDGRSIPGNSDLDEAERSRRVSEILEPYQGALEKTLTQATRETGSVPVLVAMHSFSRTYGGKPRACDIGVIFEGEQEFALAFLDNLTALTELRVLHNEPYRIDFEGDYTIPHHHTASNIPYVELEICQDLIADCKGQRDIARLLVTAFEKTLNMIGG